MKGWYCWFALLLTCCFATSCKDQEKVFNLLSPERSGISFANTLNPTEDLNILTYLYYYNGGGVAVADFNNDKLNDIYFTSNQGPDKLYINEGNMSFKDVTTISGIENSTGWTTGVTHVDINNDGLLDLYISKVGGYKNIDGTNLLFVNQGNINGVPVFKEDAASYNLDITTFSTQSAFFDYDLDGDLDMFLLTHSVHPNRSYGSGKNRQVPDPFSGDKLLENQSGKFVDVSERAKIFQSKIGYGLGISIGDLNQDGYPDVYVGNDFFENDYCYINLGDGTFREVISEDATVFGHTTHYSMGNSIADLNNDGLVDVVSVDMLPEDIATLKSSGVEDGFPVYSQFLRNGYAPQFMQNTLHLNRGRNMFSEVAFQSGVAATEWSWGVLAADFDMDGLKDLFISNGIVGATNDMDYVNFASQDHIQRQIAEQTQQVTLDFAKEIPRKETQNYFFLNTGDAIFKNVTNDWSDGRRSFSNGCAFGDLDNDGDLDLVVNNINADAFILENGGSRSNGNQSVTIQFDGPAKNRFGIGSKVEVFAGKLSVYEEHFPVKSYLSAMPNDIVVGIGKNSTIDSLRVTWPDLSVQTIYNVSAGSTLEVSYKNARAAEKVKATLPDAYLENTQNKLAFKHEETPTLDFERDPLIPFALSNEGPRIAVSDINGDSLDDIFIGGAKLQSSELFLQQKSGEFISSQKELFQTDSRSEDVDQIFFDADGDKDKDLLIVSGGNEFTSGNALNPRLYINDGGIFKRDNVAFAGVEINASVVKAIDVEKDGDFDVIIGSNALPGKFAEPSINLFFLNDGRATFTPAPKSWSAHLTVVGLVNDVMVVDVDHNGYDDLIVVGDWMPLTFYLNNGKEFTTKSLENTEGWWKSVSAADFDKDGDVDIVAGNWGHNSRLSASAKEPVELYRADFDNNGATETLVTYHYKGKRTLIPSKDELQRQMPLVKKKYTSYREFAEAEVEDIVPAGKLNAAMRKNAKMLSSCYFENSDGNFLIRPLPFAAQQSTVNAIFADDFNSDGLLDLLLVGNDYELSTQLGRLDASHGVLLLNDKSGFFKEHTPQTFNIAGPARDIEKIVIGEDSYYAISINNNEPIFVKKVR